MCLIVDANCLSDALKSDPHQDFAPIVEALLSGKAKLTLGGTQLKKEYLAQGVATQFVKTLDRAGRTVLVNDASVDAEQQSIEAGLALKSDDPHILALARVSGARLLCSRDVNLHQDFGDPNIIASPRGSIYQNAGHKRLIRKCC